MELAFANKLLRELCEGKAAAESEFGTTVARSLRRRVSDLRAADSVADLVASSAGEHGSPRVGQYVVKLSDGWQVVFTANHRDTPLLKDGEVDWLSVTRIKILRIEHSDDRVE